MPYKDPEKQKEYNRKYQTEYNKTHRAENNAKAKRYREKNHAKVLEREAAYREANREAINERNRIFMIGYRLENPDYNAEWRAAHPEEVREYNARYVAEHAAEMNAYSQLRRARELGAPHYEVVNRIIVAMRDNWICQLCFEPIDPNGTYKIPGTNRNNPWYLNMDHIIPLSKGGDHTYDNTQASHARCNNRKKAKLPTTD